MAELLHLFIDRVDTPVGELFVVADRERRLRAIDWTEYEPRLLRRLALHYGEGAFELQPKANPGGFVDALMAYFDGDLAALEGLPVETGGTPFQRAVWRALREIPCGTTATYGDIARRIGRPTAFRAVGMANNANPVGIVVPCHRVVGQNGSLTGYGGGMDRKRWLLEHEARAALKPTQAAANQPRGQGRRTVTVQSGRAPDTPPPRT